MLEGAGPYLTLFYTCIQSLALSLTVALINAQGSTTSVYVTCP